MKSRLKKKLANFGDYLTDFTGDMYTENGSMKNFSNQMYDVPSGIKFPDFQDAYNNNSKIGRTYGPNIDRTWSFEQLNDHAEWMLRDMG